MVYRTPPPQFNPQLEAVGCFCEYKNKILLLHRNKDDQYEGQSWGLPSGQIEFNERPFRAVSREVEEETGLVFPDNRFEFIDKFYIKHPLFDFIYHLFFLKLSEPCLIKINPAEHQDYLWLLPSEALKQKLFQGTHECIRLFYEVL